MPQIEREINSALFLLSGAHPSYEYIELKSQNLESALENLDDFNVTTSYKQEIIKYLSSVAENVELLQSVNTIKRLGKNLVGYNTDFYGFMQTLKMLNILPPKSFCIVSTKATARAIAVELANWEVLNLKKQAFIVFCKGIYCINKRLRGRGCCE